MSNIVHILLYGFIALGFLVIVHEFGHFLMAKLTGVKVITFSIGFGPKIFKFKKGETEYAVSAVPLGGYVKLLGESPDEEINEEEAQRSFSNKSPLVRILIAFIGPFFNILLTLVLFYIIGVTGFPVPTARVGSVTEGSPAQIAGIRAGDIVESVAGQKTEEWLQIPEAIENAPKGPIPVEIRRGDKTIQLTITPTEIEDKDGLGTIVKRKVIGIKVSDEEKVKRLSLLESVSYAYLNTYYISELTVVFLGKLIQGKLSLKTIGGPILIFKEAGRRAQKGLNYYIHFVALISINLAILNLLPIPILDGGHILFNLIEAVIRKKISQRTINIAQQVGLFIIICLMILAFYNDFDRMFNLSKFFHGK